MIDEIVEYLLCCLRNILKTVCFEKEIHTGFIWVKLEVYRKVLIIYYRSRGHRKIFNGVQRTIKSYCGIDLYSLFNDTDSYFAGSFF